MPTIPTTNTDWQDTTLAFIGSGIMAEAMIKVILDKGLVAPAQITASGPRAERGQVLAERYHICTTTVNRDAVQSAAVVVLSVKPQVMPQVLPELRGHIPPAALVLSIVAGVPMQTIAAGLAHPAVVRVMPNTPAQIGQAMSVWTATPAATARQRDQARAILQAMGAEIYGPDEDALDMATAVSGTGPTYVFLMMEAMIDAAVHMGLSRRVARDLVIQTVLGSVLFAQQSDRHLAELRNMVTSPGGTSADAIYQLEKGGLRTVLSKAIWAAYQKSRLLGERCANIGQPEPNGLRDGG
ncbi:MAG: pyrroline-5-carboxylate reductase [Chloroflexi bacterium]|nr:pyrroline-5-carboxylate reductase [Chloroflexota bacterium]MBU1747468.1 pyrroline-5-carboxylate reductase [Chloroflexota bacterium]